MHRRTESYAQSPVFRTTELRVIGVLIFAVSGVLLTSIGGAGMVASPVTLPLMYLIVRVHPTRAFRAAGMIIGGLTALEAGWGIGYVVVFDHGEGATLLGLRSVVLTVMVFASVWSRPARSEAQD